jgi:transposase
MAKKNFSSGIDSLFQDSKKEVTKEISKEKEKQIASFCRTTLIVNNDTYEKIKAIAYWERKAIKDIIENTFKHILSEYSSEKLNEILEYYRQNNK